ncbi:mitochondrial fission 1 protein [Aspergillus clavatus NRRL 1]|uniref:Mitochondrial fission 1 protein n=1 Tax=Aspergillus clavatus (strain ATCC 1007 / CBS 513.65 / DSM 816 / NCTC 3887 / NRRL 1 / QM 1276 / 107) TaxID=344612 RepID=A1C709_ASPCL|nr:mitochondrial membrane fission protein (Fis1), putative [Aspergillus clavatus NRRL 1]EAW14180.1 mitochondrial membrane fission protein (Fis1), putative [Aspergillus clavatus NRRL 1]
MGSNLPCMYTPPRLQLFYLCTRTNHVVALDAADAESPLKPAELQVLRAQYEKEGDYVGIQTKFNYAWGLIKSNARTDQQEGVRLLSEIFRASPERRRECLYYLALGNYKLGNYGEARRYNDLLLEKEPANLQAASLGSLIDDKVSKEGLMGIAIVGGLALAAGLVGGIVFKGAAKRR